jgi:hypothetical protein
MAEQTRLSFTTSVIMINRCDGRWSLNVTIIVLLQRRKLIPGACHYSSGFCGSGSSCEREVKMTWVCLLLQLTSAGEARL